VKTEGR